MQDDKIIRISDVMSCFHISLHEVVKLVRVAIGVRIAWHAI